MKLLKMALAASMLLACGGPKKTAQPARNVVTETKVEILPAVRFSEGTTLSPDGLPNLEATASTLVGNLDILVVAVSASAASPELSEARGKVIIAELVKMGVAEDRLRNQPADSAGEAADEAVEFMVLERRGDE